MPHNGTGKFEFNTAMEFERLFCIAAGTLRKLLEQSTSVMCTNWRVGRTPRGQASRHQLPPAALRNPHRENLAFPSERCSGRR
jgi:hypothetical protein